MLWAHLTRHREALAFGLCNQLNLIFATYMADMHRTARKVGRQNHSGDVVALSVGEERRLFYVGVTRARDALRVSYVRTAALSAGNAVLAPSHFLAEAGLSLGGKSTLLTPPDDDDPSFPRDEDGVFDYATSRGIQ